jgi:hypothetical protein
MPTERRVERLCERGREGAIGRTCIVGGQGDGVVAGDSVGDPGKGFIGAAFIVLKAQLVKNF